MDRGKERGSAKRDRVRREREVEIQRWLHREKRGRVHREKWELRERG
jgi:hypothetical protein